jgi:anti-anti-sigma factor
MSEQLAQIQAQRTGDLVAIAVTGEVDMSNAASIRDDIEDAIDGAASVDIDLSAVEFIDSQGIRILHQLAVAMKASDTTLRLIAPSDSIARQVLDLTSTQDVVTVVDSAG